MSDTKSDHRKGWDLHGDEGCQDGDCHCYERGRREGHNEGWENACEVENFDSSVWTNGAPHIATLPDIALAHRYRTGLIRVREYADEMAERVLQRDLDGL